MSSVCRVCLDSNDQLLPVKNNTLLNIYEKITNIKFNSDDARPRALCCFCYQKLLRCHTFSQMAVRSEKIFSHFYDKGLEITDECITEINLNVKQHLSTTTSYVTIDINTNAGSQVTIKDEPIPSIDINEELITYEEDISDQENDTEEPLSVNIHNDQSKAHDSSFTINDDITEEITTELDKLVEIGPFPEQRSRSRLTLGHKNYLVCHQSTHTGENQFSCTVCKKQFKGHFADHMRIHTREKPFACHVCQKRFCFKRALSRHMMVHTGEKPFACNVCEKQFKRKVYLVCHMRIHTQEKPFACHVCQKRFCFKRFLSRHMMVHTEEKPFACNVCEKQFKLKCNLVCHMKIHTGEKPFACDVCQKIFCQKSNLTRHKMIHTGKNPSKTFACHVCQKIFCQKSNLTRHKMIHTEEKPFACNVCEKQFKRKVYLVCHIRRIHRGEKPFACDVCQKIFCQKSNLTRHKMIHTGKNPSKTSHSLIKSNRT